MTAQPFTYTVSQVAIDDLRDRLTRTRWPEREPVADWSQGVPLGWLKEVCEYWRDQYDFAAGIGRINQFSQAITHLDGLDIHYLHVRSPEPNAVPLIMTHGWPGSIVEFLETIGPLTDPRAHGGDPADAFHVVCPSLPGYGYSGKPDRTGWNVERIGRAWAALMAELGYGRYIAHGGDWGAAVTACIGAFDPEHCIAVHFNIVPCMPSEEQMAAPTEEELGVFAKGAEHAQWGTGYSWEQKTRPQTVGYSLVDSPSGMAGWILEKFWAWTDCDGHPENALTKDQLIDNLSWYWFSGTGASSARLYWESFDSWAFAGGPVSVPMGSSNFPKEVSYMPRRWAENRYSDIRYWEFVDKGGHFPAFEQPVLFSNELRKFGRLFR